MTDITEGNVVPFTHVKLSPEGWGQRAYEALLIARLAAMSQLEYERARIWVAKELGCRVSWLDRTISGIWGKTACCQHLPPSKDGRKVGDAIDFWPDRGPPILGFITATESQDGKDWHYLVLADGNGTCVRSTPISKERADELRGQLSKK
jgi:hypothetical protein